MALTQVSTAGVKDDAVTAGKIPANAVGSSELADSAVDTNAIQANAVTNAKIGDTEITGNKLADQAVTLDKLPHGTSSNNGKFLRANNGADPSFENPAITSINGAGNNRLITSDGGTTVTAEDSVTFNGSQLDVISATIRGDAFIGRSNISTPTADVSLYRAADNTLALATSSTERLRINSNGNVGIGETAPGDNRIRITSPLQYNVVAKSSNGNGGYENFTGITSAGAKTFYVTHNGRVGAADGIIFGSDTAAGNILDDYEEGNFGATFANVDNSVITTNHFTYTKVGRLVHFEAKFTVGSTVDGSAFGFTLPFTQAGSRETVIPAISTRSGSNTAPFAFVINANQSYAYGKQLDGFSDSQTAYNTFSGDIILVSGTYEAA